MPQSEQSKLYEQDWGFSQKSQSARFGRTVDPERHNPQESKIYEQSKLYEQDRGFSQKSLSARFGRTVEPESAQ
jgi:hypothetical protein